MESITNIDDSTIIVEFSPSAGTREVSLKTPQDLAIKSAEALDKAMVTIRQMAQRTMATIDTLANKPSQVELEFGIKLNTEAGAIIAKTAGEASLKVKLTWERKEPSNEPPTS